MWASRGARMCRAAAVAVVGAAGAQTMMRTTAEETSLRVSPDDNKAASLKGLFARSYDEVAEGVAHRVTTESPEVMRMRRRVCQVLMDKLGYTTEELEMIGDDVDLMQGTGNPHTKASLQQGERVLDLGSGFGVDCLLAAHRVQQQGRVLGVDISKNEVEAANARAKQRGVDEYVRFVHADMEDLPIPDNVIDCVISNGGFCLCPDKEKAFKEIQRVLKPGGRFAISCTTLSTSLSEDTEWPACMQVFYPKDKLPSLLQSLGFVDIEVDDSNSKMSLWDDVNQELSAEVEETLSAHLAVDTSSGQAVLTTTTSSSSSSSPSSSAPSAADAVVVEDSQKGVHNDDPAFSHLSSLSMDDICARVVVSAVKPR